MGSTPNGILLVDKAEGWTSHDVVAKARRALGTRKVGHAGTLDPMATGLLLLGTGPSTRLLTHLVGLDKTYTAMIRLGQSTLTDDREGEVLATAASARMRELLDDSDAIREAVAELTGDIEQVPSAVSAIKVDGRRAYERVRAGEQVELKRRPVTIHSFEIGEPRLVELTAGSVPTAEAAPLTDRTADAPLALEFAATVRCSSGTYVRALARDLGEALGVGGHLTALRRRAIGPFSVEAAVANERLAQGAPVSGELLPPAEVAARLFPVLALDDSQEVDLGHGRRFLLGDGQLLSDGSDRAVLAAAVAPSGRLVGLVEVKNGRVRAVTNFPSAADDGSATA